MSEGTVWDMIGDFWNEHYATVIMAVTLIIGVAFILLVIAHGNANQEVEHQKCITQHGIWNVGSAGYWCSYTNPTGR